MITSKKTRTEVRYAQVRAEGRWVTIAELEALVEAAKSAGVPGDTVIRVPTAVTGVTAVSYVEVEARIEVQD